LCFSSRIRYLNCVSGPPLDPFVSCYLSALLKGQSLTPKPKSLNHDMTPSIMLYIAPTLRALRIARYISRTSMLYIQHLPNFLHGLAHSAPSLESLSFSDCIFQEDSIYEILGQFTQLRHLEWSEQSMASRSSLESRRCFPCLKFGFRHLGKYSLQQTYEF
jgi:hypothetical protein